MKFNLPSPTQLVQEASKVWLRFPVVMTVASCISIFTLMLNHDIFGKQENETIVRFLFTIVSLIPLGTGIRIRQEVQKINLSQSAFLYTLSIGLVYYMFTLIDANMGNAKLLQYFLCISAVHLIACSLPFIGSKHSNSFWHYNRILLNRILLSVFYTGFLFAGLSIALLALDHLLGINVRENLYGDLGILLAGIFNTWFFLAGLPRNWEELNENSEYPKGLRIFSEYVLIPLVIVYLVILYLYSGKTLINQEWPLTWMGYLVMGFSVSGILAMLLVWPIRKIREYSWIYFFSKWYLPALIPLTILLLITIGRQINNYGITPNRYVLAMLTVWVLSISIGYILKGFKNIQLIPVSLTLICLLAAMGGPLNLLEVSMRNQQHRLEEILIQNYALCEGKICRPDKEISTEDLKTISEKLNFFEQNRDSSWIQKYMPQEQIDSMRAEGYDGKSGYQYVTVIMNTLGGYPGSDYSRDYENAALNSYTILSGEKGISVEGYSHIQDFSFSNYESEEEERNIFVKDFPVKIYYLGKRNAFQIEDPDETRTEIALADSMKSWTLKWGKTDLENYPDELRIKSATTNYLVSIVFTNLLLERNKEKELRVQNVEGKIMIIKKDKPEEKIK